MFRLTYEFPLEAACIRDPDLEVCVYHDARLAEVRSFRGFQRHPHLASSSPDSSVNWISAGPET